MGQKLVLQAIDTSITAAWTVAASTYVLALDNKNYNVPLGALNAATPTAAASAIADAVNAAQLVANGQPICAAVSITFLLIESVETDDVSGPISINMAGTAVATTTNWTASVVENPFVDPMANYVPKSAATSQVMDAFAAGAKLDRQVRVIA